MAWLSGYSYRKPITIESDYVDADLANFPLTIVLNSTNFSSGFSACRSDGYDIVFTKADGTSTLYFEREYYDNTNSLARFHVCVDAIDDTLDTTIYMYYGKSSDTDHQSVANVWDSDYIAVWHLGVDFADSKNSYDGTNTGTAESDTAYGKMRYFDGSDYITMPDFGDVFSPTSSFTISYLLSLDDSGGAYNECPFRWADSGHDCIAYRWTGSTTYSNGEYKGSYLGDSWTVADDTIYAFSFREIYGGNWELFKDGTASSSPETEAWNPNAVSGINCVGGYNATTYRMHGRVGLMRISTTNRTDAWCKAETRTLNQTLQTVGTQETNGITLSAQQDGTHIDLTWS